MRTNSQLSWSKCRSKGTISSRAYSHYSFVFSLLLHWARVSYTCCIQFSGGGGGGLGFKNRIRESGLLRCLSKPSFSPILQRQQGDLPKLTPLPLSTVRAVTLFWQPLMSCRAQRNIGSTASFLPGRARDRMNCDFFPWDMEGWLVRNETGQWLLFTEGQVHEQCATLAPSSSWTRLKINQNSKGKKHSMLSSTVGKWELCYGLIVPSLLNSIQAHWFSVQTESTRWNWSEKVSLSSFFVTFFM